MEQRSAFDTITRTSEGRLLLGWRLALFAALTICVGGVLAVILPAGIQTSAATILVGSVVAGIVLLGIDGRAPGALGFHMNRGASVELLMGIALGTILALAVVCVLFAAGGLRWTSQDGSVGDWLAVGVGALAFLALPAAAEEALLRGYPLQALAERWGPALALVATALVFGALHRSNPGVTWVGTFNVALAGVFLGVVYLRTASLWWATGAHLGWNWGTGFVADVPVSGLELLDAPFYEALVQGPAWLGGGSFGPEGSIVTTAFFTVASFWCWRTPWLRPSEAALKTRPLAVTGETDG